MGQTHTSLKVGIGNKSLFAKGGKTLLLVGTLALLLGLGIVPDLTASSPTPTLIADDIKTGSGG